MSITGITANNKTYDSDTTATLVYTGATFSGKVAGDDLTIEQTGTGTFAQEHVGTGITVNITNLSISGSDISNYSFTTTASTTANITAKALTATGITAENKTYDSNTSATLVYTSATLSQKIAGDDLTLVENATGTFSQEHVGTGITVNITGLTLSGTDAVNYSFTNTASTTANITAKPITESGITA